MDDVKRYYLDLGSSGSDLIQVAMYWPDRIAPLPPLCFKQLGQFVLPFRTNVSPVARSVLWPLPHLERSPSPGVSYSVYEIPLPDAPCQSQSISAPALTDPPELPRRSSRRRRQPTRLDL
ncbi:hypothetical protein BgiBS90_037424 [Biomphalaria glabrata]|nr:hypothetical protein BgiBS90_037424 [Biomphalaria glabrata]